MSDSRVPLYPSGVSGSLIWVYLARCQSAHLDPMKMTNDMVIVTSQFPVLI
jgi:hypothetical protein